MGFTLVIYLSIESSQTFTGLCMDQLCPWRSPARIEFQKAPIHSTLLSTASIHSVHPQLHSQARSWLYVKRQSGLDKKSGDPEHQKPTPIQKDALPLSWWTQQATDQCATGCPHVYAQLPATELKRDKDICYRRRKGTVEWGHSEYGVYLLLFDHHWKQ